jgi:hypothetical protein
MDRSLGQIYLHDIREKAGQKSIPEFIEKQTPAFRIKSLFLWLRKTAKHFFIMKISYNWLKDYIELDESPEEVAKILTQTGLEVAGVEEVETVKGGMEGLVLGQR